MDYVNHFREQAYYFLEGITQEQAYRYGETFQQFTNLSSLIAYQSEVYLGRIDLYGSSNLNLKEQLTIYPKNGIFANLPSDRVSANYWDSSTISPEIHTQINALSHLDPLLEKAQKSNPSAVAVWVLMESTVLRYYPNTPLVAFLPPKTEDDLRNGIFYTIATPKNNPDRKTLWTKVYQDPGGQGLMTSVTTPLYSQAGQFLGVAGIEATLNNIVKEIREADPVIFLSTLNRTLYTNIQRLNSDKNLTLAILNYGAGQISISGQHKEIIIVRNGGQIECIDTMNLGFPIGLIPEIADCISHQMVELEYGDGVVLYTDGITEAQNINKKLYGLERLCEIASQHWHLSAEEIKQAIIKDVREFIGKNKVFDDITLVVFKRQDDLAPHSAALTVRGVSI